jgi:chromosome segregation ATPase
LSTFVANLIILVCTALTVELASAKKALSEEKTARLAVDQSLAEEKAAQRSVEQSLWAFKKAKAALNQDLLSTHASLTTTKEKLSSKSSALDHAVIKERKPQIKLKATGEKMKDQEQQLASAQKALSKREFSSSIVANAMVLVKNHMPEFDAEILQKDFIVHDVRWASLVNCAYDTTQHFVSLYDFSVLTDSDDNASPGAL